MRNRAFKYLIGYVFLLNSLIFSSLAMAVNNEQFDELFDSPLFKESLIFGRVYVDENNNGSQDKDEPGVMGVRLVTISGEIITTDAYGRYSLHGLEPESNIRGSNFLIKLDKSSLPEGYKVIGNETIVVRLTSGMPQRVDFRLTEK